MNRCRLIIDDASPGAWNMAVDEVLLEAVARRGPALRYYQWSQPTLSLGYFQRCADRRLHPSSLACPLVRRASGGGAIVHDRELTYALCLPAGHALAARAEALYQSVHSSLVESLSRLGVVALVNTGAGPTPGGGEPFLCFQRRSAGDVLLGRHKIAGSAQRRRPGGIVQHGSVVLARSQAAPEVPGIACLSGARLSAADLIHAWTADLAARLALVLDPGQLDAEEVDAAARLVERKYAHPDWTHRR